MILSLLGDIQGYREHFHVIPDVPPFFLSPLTAAEITLGLYFFPPQTDNFGEFFGRSNRSWRRIS